MPPSSARCDTLLPPEPRNSIFYFGWLIWAIPSNLIMQRSPPAYYLSFNIFMWGAVLMYVPSSLAAYCVHCLIICRCGYRLQAISKNFATLAALRVISGAFEAIADPAFMLFTTMYYTRAVSVLCRADVPFAVTDVMPCRNNHPGFPSGTGERQSVLCGMLQKLTRSTTASTASVSAWAVSSVSPSATSKAPSNHGDMNSLSSAPSVPPGVFPFPTPFPIRPLDIDGSRMMSD